MVNRTFNICVADDNRDNAEALAVFLSAYSNTSELPFKVAATPFYVSGIERPLSEDLLDKNSDMYFLDFDFRGSGRNIPEHSKNGLVVAQQIHSKRPHVPITIFTGKEPSEMIGPLQEIVRTRAAGDVLFIKPYELEEKVTVLRKGADPSKILQSIVENAVKPLNIGITGYGTFGRTIAGLCYSRPDIIEKASVFSRHLSKDLPKAREAFTNKYGKRIAVAESLDELVQSAPDVLVLGTSDAWNYEQNVKLMPKSGDYARLSLFKHEVELYSKMWDTIINGGFKGIVIPAANPPGGIAEIACIKNESLPEHERFNTQQITFPLNASVERAMKYIEEHCKLPGRWSQFKVPMVESLLEQIRKYAVVGLHGMPMYAPPHESSHVGLFGQILNVPPNSWGAGVEQMKLQQDTEVFITKAAELMFEWFEDVAHYKEEPKKACYVNDPALDAFVALPVKMRYLSNGKMEIGVNERISQNNNIRREGIIDCPDFDYSNPLEPVFDSNDKISLQDLLRKHNNFYRAVLKSLDH